MDPIQTDYLSTPTQVIRTKIRLAQNALESVLESVDLNPTPDWSFIDDQLSRASKWSFEASVEAMHQLWMARPK